LTYPDISFVIASYNASAFLADAVRSALDQRGVAVEVIIVDDGSSDDSREIAEQLAATDPRVRSLQTPVNRGPGGARNVGIVEARGRWIAVLDSDDLLHPDRSRRLLDEAEAVQADMVADDLMIFDDSRVAKPSLFLDARRVERPGWIDLAAYLNETRMFGRRPNLGFLKPMMRTAFLRDHAIRYDESLRIAEDDALVISLLREGARYRILPQPLYFYRKHGASISHRLSGANVDRMRAADDKLCTAFSSDSALARAFAPRDRALTRAWAFTHMLEALKARRPARALSLVARHPTVLPLLGGPLAGIFRKLRARIAPSRSAPLPDPKAVLFISRQRLIGATNGSSAYLIAIAEGVRAAGFVPHLLQPSPGVFGRTPFYRLRPEMAVFATNEVRGAIRLGGWMIARSPAVHLAAARGVLAGVLRRAGVRHPLAVDRKLPPSISAPWRREDLLAVADWGRRRPGVAIADYVFQTEALPYLTNPALRSATVMHDLFHARAEQFAANGDSVALLSREQEISLLGSADAVIAIQAAEAAFVADNVPGTRPILVHMPATTVAVPQSGDPDVLLFVGSNTAPNVLALEWLFETIWPRVLASRPASRLEVAGTVSRAFPVPPAGVRFLGLVDDLAARYAVAGIVISPLRQGSGLKIKLIEALAHGKACVVTGITLQGVEGLLSDAVVRADDADAFVDAILALQADTSGRTALAVRALAAAKRHFGSDACIADLRGWLNEPSRVRSRRDPPYTLEAPPPAPPSSLRA